MPKVDISDIRDCSREFLEGMAKALARTIDAGQTRNAEGDDLRELLDAVVARIPDAPEYHIEHRRRR